MPREPHESSDRTDDTPDTPATTEPEALQPQEQEQREIRELTATAEQYLAAHPPSPDDRQTREDHLDHAQAALHTPDTEESIPPPTDVQLPDDGPETAENPGDYVQLTADAEYHLACHPPTPEELDARDDRLDRVATSLQDQPHDSAPLPQTIEPHDSPPRSTDEPHPEDTQLQPQEPTNPNPIADLNLERDLPQPHDTQRQADTEPKELTPHEPPEPLRNAHDPINLITSFTQSEATKEGDRPHMSERVGALNQLLDQNPYLRDRPSFDEGYRQAQAYIVVKALQARDALPPYTQAETADRAGVATATLANWLHDHTQPELIYKLTIHETARRHAEAQLPTEARDHHLDPTTTYNAFREFRAHPSEATPHELATSIAALYRTADHPPVILFADFKSYHESGPRWMRTLADTIQDNRPEIERLVNQQLGFNQDADTKLRLGVTDHALYMWRSTTHADDWLTLYNQEHFYFHDPTTKPTLLADARNHLNTSTLGLSHLATQLTDHPSHQTDTKIPVSDLQGHTSYLIGETLRFLLDATGKSFEEFHPNISHIGRGTYGGPLGGIHDPRFPTGETLNEFRARAYAIIVSDGSIGSTTHAPMYVQSDLNRVAYVKALFNRTLGDVHSNLETRPDGRLRLTMTVTVGRLLEKWGMPAGDKPLQNATLPETIKNGTPETKRAYLQELIPEEGCFFRFTHHRGDFSVKRVSVLDAGTKAETYRFSPIIQSDLKSFLRRYGNEHSLSIRNEIPRKEVKMNWGQLDRMERQETNASAADMARELKKTVLNNPCQLLEDEKELCKSLGIGVEIHPKQICLHESGRVSVVWEARTKTTEDAFRWAIQAPPSSGRKLEATNRWLAAYDDEVQSIRHQLWKDGLIEHSEKR